MIESVMQAREQGRREMLEAVRDLIRMPDQHRYDLFNAGERVSIRYILENNSPFVFLKTMQSQSQD